MRNINLLSLLMCLLALFVNIVPANAAPQFVLNDARYIISNIVEDFQPSVVNISVEEMTKEKNKTYNSGNPFAKRDSNSKLASLKNKNYEGLKKIQSKKKFSLGSGIIISENGFVITNYHVVELASKINVKTLNNGNYEAKLIGFDEKTDIALLKIDTKEKLPHIEFDDSNKTRVGEIVIAAGNPYGLEGSISMGIISARNRNLGSNIYDDFLQTDASINPGNSGGPLFNLEGKVIGINTAIYSKAGGSDGIGFAIPSNTVKLIVKQLKTNGKVIRGWLGIEAQKLDKSIANALHLDSSKGVLVTGVVRNSPAEMAGIKSGDVIIKYNNEPINTLFDLPKMVSETVINSNVKIVVFRDKKQIALETKIISTQQAEDIAAKNVSVQALNIKGIYLSNITENLKSDFKLNVDEGIVVVAIDKNLNANIRKGDVILQVNQKNVHNLKEIVKLAKNSKDDSFLLFINRQGNNIFTVLGEENIE